MTVTSQIVNLQEEYLALYNQNEAHLLNGAPDRMNELRQEAIGHFERLGIPSNKVEEYRYTNLQPFFKGTLSIGFSNEQLGVKLGDIFQCDVPELESYPVFLVNGWYSFQNVKDFGLPEGVIMGSIAEIGKKHPELLEKYYGTAANMDRDGLIAMNTAFAQDGLFLYVPKGVVVDKAIQIVNIMTGDVDRLAFQRNLVIMEENSQARIMVCEHTLSPNKYVINSVTEVIACENAVCDIYNVQNQHNLTTQVASTFIRQKAYSNVVTNNLTLHAGVARNNVVVTMEEEHCESHIYGLYLTDKNQHVDNFSFVDHAKPDCLSTELFKGVLDDRATGAFAGRVLVRKDAQRTNAYQTNKNLLLTEDAKINSKPQLEIYADDVKCSHGATVGQLDDAAMFYLRSRGVSEAEARILLMYAFAYEVIEKIRVEPLREQIRGLVEKRFRGELDKCDSCVVCGQLGNSLTCL
ncbi:Fe-S cluster assembly protein SufD [Marinilabiliaceae bacterium JC017]|nr:Fe-S cluster assembly protein SufD [Marinilabiliaceae bacterium JC017]